VAPLPAEHQPFHAVALSLSSGLTPTRVLQAEVQSTSVGAGEEIAGARTGPGQLHLSSAVDCDRITLGRPAIVRSLDAPIVLRVQARRPLSEAQPQSTRLRLAVDVSDAVRTVTSNLDVQLAKANGDHYDTVGEGRIPSELSTFYVLIPRRGQAIIRVAEGEVDLVLGELDPRAAQRRFVRRRPTNWSAFMAGGTVRLRVAHRAAPVGAPVLVAPPMTRVALPHVVGSRKRQGRTFIPASTLIPFEVRRGASSRLYLRLLAEPPADVQVLIDGGEPHRRRSGLATSITVGRMVHAEGEAKLSLVLGDDLEPGRHLLSFQPTQSKCVVHLPWQKPVRAPRQTAWVVGDFQP
jgi:hypothetical protein